MIDLHPSRKHQHFWLPGVRLEREIKIIIFCSLKIWKDKKQAWEETVCLSLKERELVEHSLLKNQNTKVWTAISWLYCAKHLSNIVQKMTRTERKDSNDGEKTSQVWATDAVSARPATIWLRTVWIFKLKQNNWKMVLVCFQWASFLPGWHRVGTEVYIPEAWWRKLLIWLCKKTRKHSFCLCCSYETLPDTRKWILTSRMVYADESL